MKADIQLQQTLLQQIIKNERNKSNAVNNYYALSRQLGVRYGNIKRAVLALKRKGKVYVHNNIVFATENVEYVKSQFDVEYRI